MTKITLHFKSHEEADKFFGWFVDGGGEQEAEFISEFTDGYSDNYLAKIENLDLTLTYVGEENL